MQAGILTTIYIVGVMFLAILAHEVGHLIYFDLALKKKVRMHFRWKSILDFGLVCGEEKDYINMTKDQYKTLIFFGVFAGFITIFMLGMMYTLTLLLLIPYFIGCWFDIKELQKIIQEEESIQ